jgi:hypothetical protein
LVDGVVELLGVVVLGVDCEFGVVTVPFGVVVAPLEVDPGVIVVPLLLLVPVVSVELPVFEDCGTADPLAGTQSALAVLVVPGVEVVLVEVVPAVELLGEVLLLELGIELVELLGVVLLLEVGVVLLLELGDVVVVELLGVEAVVLVVPVAFALVRGTMPAGQLLVEEALGVVEVVPVVEDPACEEDGIVELLPVVLPVCDEVEGVVVVVVLVVEEVCAAAHVAHAVRTRIIVSFFMFFCPRGIEWLYTAMPISRGRCADQKTKKGQPFGLALLVDFSIIYGFCDGTTRLGPSSRRQVASGVVAEKPSVAFRSPTIRHSGRWRWLKPRPYGAFWWSFAT